MIPGDPLFRFEGVSVRFDGPEVLADVTLDVADGCITVFAGPSGAGKTTLLRLCNRLEVPTSGTVRFRGDDLDGLDPLALRRRVGMVFQRPTLFPGSLRDNFTVARPAGDEEYRAGLESVGLPGEWLDREADGLSGGEAQRACLARTLLTGPEVLLMDEPTSSLDPAATRLLEELSTGLARTGLAVLWVSHDLAQVDRIADATVVLDGGRVVGADRAAAYLGGVDGPGDDDGAGPGGDPGAAGADR